MEKKKALRLGAAGMVGLVVVAAAALALAPERRGLASIDLNQDGQIVNAEVQQSARQRFAGLDSNKDGRLTGEEWPGGRHGRRGGRHQGGDDFALPAAQPAAAAPVATSRPFRRGWAAADLDADGALTLREFYARHAARVGRADANGDGTISAEELANHRPRRGGRRH
jgi:hypothetical protein